MPFKGDQKGLSFQLHSEADYGSESHCSRQSLVDLGSSLKKTFLGRNQRCFTLKSGVGKRALSVLPSHYLGPFLDICMAGIPQVHGKGGEDGWWS